MVLFSPVAKSKRPDPVREYLSQIGRLGGGPAGGKARMAQMTPAERSAFARAGGLARAKQRKKAKRKKRAN